MTKKARPNIPQLAKVRATLQKEIQSQCPFCENDEVGHFEIHHIDEDPSNNDTANLLLLCPICHSKITKGDISMADTYKKKISLVTGDPPWADRAKNPVTINNNSGNTVVGNNNHVAIKQIRKTVKQKYPEGCIGFDSVKANYISHLIGRYNDYKEYEVGKGNVNYAVFSAHLKKQYKIGPTRTILNLPIEKFEELAAYIQKRIDGTMLAKTKRGSKNYSTFLEYVAAQK